MTTGINRPEYWYTPVFWRKRMKESVFYKGVDISSLPEHEDGGEVFFSADGRKVDAFELLKESGINSIRLRLWNDPKAVPEARGYCDIEHTIGMAKRIKEHGFHLYLDYHYSDYWADPGQQRKPHEWQNLDFDGLVKAVHDFTYETLTRMKAEGVLPDMVQVGNEIRSGMLFPDGAVPNYDNLAKLVNAGIRACREVSSDICVMIHLDQGGRFYYAKEWFDSMFAAGLEKIDVIGISFYSFWHGTFMDLRDTMKGLIERYKLPILCVETAHPWRHCEHEHVSKGLMKNAGFAAGPDNQKKSLELIMKIASSVADGRMTGVYYWEPLCIPGKTYGSWDENMGMLDENGRALCGFEAFRDFDPLWLERSEEERRSGMLRELDEYMNDLYMASCEEKQPEGANLVPNGDFSQGTKGWWILKEKGEIEVVENDHEIYVSSKENFVFDINRDLRITEPGTYRLSVEYRGTNTTGVNISLYMTAVKFDGENRYEETIYPSDVRFDKISLASVTLTPGTVKVGVHFDTPPIFGRIRNISLVKASSDDSLT